jgi:hypothetical protein
MQGVNGDFFCTDHVAAIRSKDDDIVRKQQITLKFHFELGQGTLLKELRQHAQVALKKSIIYRGSS